MTKTERDYIAIVSLMAGAGSYARGKDRDEVIERVKRITKADWKSMFPKAFKKGQVIKANVLDVTGYDQVTWDSSIYVDGKPFPGKIEMVDLAY